MVTVLDVVEAHARSEPDRIAFVTDAPIGPVTHARFFGHVRRAAAALAPEDVANRRILVVGRVSYAFEVAEKAAWWLGASVIGVDPSLPDAEIERAARAFDVACVVLTEDRSVATSRRLVALTDERLAADEHLQRYAPPARAPRAGDDEAFVVFTSGTTGAPKGIAYTHDQLLLAARAILAHVGAARAGLERTVGWLPLYNLTAKSLSAVNTLAGITTHVVRDPKDLARSLPRVEPDYVVVVPRVLEKIHAHVSAEASRGTPFRRAALRALLAEHAPSGLMAALARAAAAALRRRIFGRRIRFVVSGSAPLRPDARRLLERLGVRVVDAYGVSECIVPIAMSPLEAPAHDGAIGGVLPESEVRIADDGEILVRGPGVMRAYIGAASEQPFTPDGFYRTGDLGALDARGRLSLRGRKNDAFKTSNGVKVDPSVLEARYGACPLVEHVVVLGEGRPFLVALVTLGAAARDVGDAEREVERWFRRTAEALPRSQRVARIAFVSPFGDVDGTLTPSGKVRRVVVRAREAATVDALYAIRSDAREFSGSSAGRSPTPPPLA